MYVRPGVVEACFGVEVDPSSKLVLLVLNQYTATKDIVKHSGLSEKTVQKSLRKLLVDGFIKQTRRGVYEIAVASVGRAWVHLGYFKSCLVAELAPKVKLVALAISKHVSEDGNTCYPSVKTIANLVGMASRTVQRHIKTLIDLGFVERLKQGVKYLFRLIQISKIDTLKQVKSAPEQPVLASEEVELTPIRKEKIEKVVEEGVTASTGHDSSSGDDNQREDSMNVADVVKQQKEAAVELPKVKPNANGLVGLWKVVVARSYAIGPIRSVPVTSKQKGMLGHFIRVGKEIDGSDCRDVLIDAVSNWPQYMSVIASQAGIAQPPQVPTIEWLTKHAFLFYRHYEVRQQEAKVERGRESSGILESKDRQVSTADLSQKDTTKQQEERDEMFQDVLKAFGVGL